MAINKRGDRYVLDWWADGKRYRKFFDTKHEAEAHQTVIRKRKLDGDYIAPDRIPLFKDTAAAWLATRTNRAASSYDEFAARINRHLLPAFGHLRLNQIKPDAIEKWRAMLSQRGGTSQWGKPLAPRTIASIQGVLSNILDSAVRNQRLTANSSENS
jgi:hypothetical protein